MTHNEKMDLMTQAVLDRYIETGKASCREDIAAACGVSASTVGKWLGECGGVPNGCSYELRSRRGGGGGKGKEHFYPRIQLLRAVIIEKAQELASVAAG